MSKISILYVEDNDELRETVCELMEADGREVVAVDRAEDALAALSERVFDVLVTDISLPGLSGTELVRRVLAQRPEQWVIFCSGYDLLDGLSSFGVNVRAIPKAFEVEVLDLLLEEIVGALNDGQAG